MIVPEMKTDLSLQFISLREFQTITDALNFSTSDCHLIGSCDLYTTKAAGSDKKLYKNIETTLESQHESLVRLSASLSPPQIPVDGKRRSHTPMNVPEIDLSRDSPFGPFTEIGARRVFAYLIATLNAAHPDYEFSNTLRPLDFRKTSGTMIKKAVDSTLMNMRPRRMASSLAPPSKSPYSSSIPLASPNPEIMWSEGMWELIDQEMDLRHCEKYTWDPEDDPFEEENALWGQHHFFFNKDKKRVCYLHFRAFSVISHSPLQSSLPQHARSIPQTISIGDSASKRAQYWLGHGVEDKDVDSTWAEDDDQMATDDDADSYEYTDDLDDVRDHLEDGCFSYTDSSFLGSDDATGWDSRSNARHRGSSEGVMEPMEL